MPRRRHLSPPSYCLHKASGRAVVRLNGRDHYLGVYGSDESHAEYQKLISLWRADSHRQSVITQGIANLPAPSLTISQLLLRYQQFAKTYYVNGDEPSKEYEEMGFALRPVRVLYGAALAREFGPLKLQAVRQHMIESDLSRGVINNRMNRIKRCFKWAVSQELIPSSVYEGLRTVIGLKKGRTRARETEPVKPVPDEYVEAIIPFVTPHVAAMIQLQRLTGMRPGEVVKLRACDIDTGGEVWVFAPSTHKNSWRGHDRQIPLGPKAQELLKPFLENQSGAFLFSPKESEDWRNAARRQARQTPMTPSQRNRRPKSAPGRAKRDHYDTASYRRAIKYGIQKANKNREDLGIEPIPQWFPLQLRHSRATELNQTFGIEATAVSLGHAHADVTKVYAERNLKLAMEVARKTG